MSNTDELLNIYRSNLIKAIDHLEYSLNKVKKLPIDPSSLDEESLETWESFSARFSRCIDIFTTKFIRTYVLHNDPGFEGSLRDAVNQAEKLGLITSANKWMEARGLRNITAHEYKEAALKEFFEDIRAFAPTIIDLKKVIIKK